MLWLAAATTAAVASAEARTLSYRNLTSLWAADRVNGLMSPTSDVSVRSAALDEPTADDRRNSLRRQRLP